MASGEGYVKEAFLMKPNLVGLSIGVVAVAVLPFTGPLLLGVAALEGAAQLPGGGQLDTWRRTIAAQVGFDPLTREGQLAAGLDPDRAAALVLLPGTTQPGWIAALPLTKPEVLGQTVDRLLRERA